MIDLPSARSLRRPDDVEVEQRLGTRTPDIADVRRACDALTALVPARFTPVWLVGVDAGGGACACVIGVSGD